ncbi:MAG: hypothetical protein NTZ65_02375 [Candidatus Berkelbacteria bacterium]|nr:hypothetical protein [Candidatus Berkelbacteria bacterium]
MFEVGDIEIQSAGSQRNFLLQRFPRPKIIFGIIHDLTNQAKKGIVTKKRLPQIETIGMLGNVPVIKNSILPPIMNFRGGLMASYSEFKKTILPAKSLRQKFDRWWWSSIKGEQALFLNYQDESENPVLQMEIKKGGKKSSGRMIDL